MLNTLLDRTIDTPAQDAHRRTSDTCAGRCRSHWHRTCASTSHNAAHRCIACGHCQGVLLRAPQLDHSGFCSPERWSWLFPRSISSCASATCRGSNVLVSGAEHDTKKRAAVSPRSLDLNVRLSKKFISQFQDELPLDQLSTTAEAYPCPILQVNRF